jgi:hypothetical protein
MNPAQAVSAQWSGVCLRAPLLRAPTPPPPPIPDPTPTPGPCHPLDPLSQRLPDAVHVLHTPGGDTAWRPRTLVCFGGPGRRRRRGWCEAEDEAHHWEWVCAWAWLWGEGVTG